MLRLMLGLILIALPMVELALLIKTGQPSVSGRRSGWWWEPAFSAPLILAHQGISVRAADAGRRWRKAGRRWHRCSTGVSWCWPARS